MFCAIILIIIICTLANAEQEQEFLSLSIGQRLELSKRAADQCRNLEAFPSDFPDSESTSLVKQLATCGFYVRKSALTTQQAESLRQEVITNGSLIHLDSAAYERGTVHMETFETSSMTRITNEKIIQACPPNGTVTRMFGDVSAGPSQDEGGWSRHDFVFPLSLLRDYGRSPSDTPFPVRLDVIFPLQDLDGGLMEICVGSQYTHGLDTADCETIPSQNSLKPLCEFITKGRCPKENIIRPRLDVGDVLVIHGSSLRRSRGSESDPKKIRVDLHVVIRYGWWWKLSNDVWNAMYHPGLSSKDFVVSAGNQETVDNKNVDMKNECSNPDLQSEEDDEEQISDECLSTVNRGTLFFGNHDVSGSDVRLYYGNNRDLGLLLEGQNLTTPIRKGIFTLRVNGVTRKSWRFQRLNETHIIYVFRQALEFFSD